jgi:hypothetical protein
LQKCDSVFPVCTNQAPSTGELYSNITQHDAASYCDKVDSCIGFISNPHNGSSEYNLAVDLNISVFTYLNITFINTSGATSTLTDTKLPNRSAIPRTNLSDYLSDYVESFTHGLAGRRRLRLTAVQIKQVVCRTDQYCTWNKLQTWHHVFFFCGGLLMLGGLLTLLALVAHPREVGLLKVDHTLSDEEQYEFAADEIEETIHKIVNEAMEAKRSQEKERRKVKAAEAQEARRRQERTPGESEPLLKAEEEDDEVEEYEPPLESWEREAAEATARNTSVSFSTSIRIPGVIEYSVACFFIQVVATVFLLWLPQYLQRELHFAPANAMEVAFLFDLGGGASCLSPCPSLAPRVSFSLFHPTSDCVLQLSVVLSWAWSLICVACAPYRPRSAWHWPC